MPPACPGEFHVRSYIRSHIASLSPFSRRRRSRRRETGENGVTSHTAVATNVSFPWANQGHLKQFEFITQQHLTP